MGSKGGGGGSGSSNFGYESGTSTYTPNPQAMAAFQQALGMGNNAVSRPYEPYGGQMTAGFTPDQLAAMQGVRNTQGIAQPYIDSATGLTRQAVDYSDPRNFNQSALNQYMSPYQRDVVKTTMQDLAEQQARAQQQTEGRAASQQGAFGGSGSFMGRAEVDRQQALANAQTLAQLNQSNYQQAVNQYNQQQGQAINAAQSAAYGLGQLGNMAQSSALTGINALLQSGALQQQLAQQQLTGAYNQWLQQKAYPYQQAAFYSGIASGIGPSMGGTTTYQGINMGNSKSSGGGGSGGGGGGGGALSSVMSFLPAMFGMSDDKEKTDKRKIGTDDRTGLDMYSYRYKGDPKTYPKVVGPMASEIEEKYPGFVFDVAGKKAVSHLDQFMPREHHADGSSAGTATSSAPASGASQQTIYSAPELNYNQGASNTGVYSDPSSGQMDPGTAQFIRGAFDPQTANQMARAKWVSRQAPTETSKSDSFALLAQLAGINKRNAERQHFSQGGFGELNPAKINPSPLSAVPAMNAAVAPPQKPPAGGLIDVEHNQSRMLGASPQTDTTGGFGLIQTPMADQALSNPGKDSTALAKKALPNPAQSTEHFTQSGVKKAKSGAAQAAKGSGGGGGSSGGGGGGGMPKMPKMEGNKGNIDKVTGNPTGQPSEQQANPSEANPENTPEAEAPKGDQVVGADAGGAGGGAEASTPEMSGGDAGGFNMDWLSGLGGMFAEGGRVHRAAGGAGGDAGGMGGGRAMADAGMPSTMSDLTAGGFGGGLGMGGLDLGPTIGLGEKVLGKNGPSPSTQAGFDKLQAGQEKRTGNDLVKGWNQEYRQDYTGGPQKSPKDYGMPDMPGQDWYNQNLNVSDLSVGSGGTSSPGGISYTPIMTGMGGGGGGGGFGLFPTFNAPTNGSDYNDTTKMFKPSPSNGKVEGYYTGLASNQVNPDTGLFNTSYLGPYYGGFYKDGGRVKAANGRRILGPNPEELEKGFGSIEQKYGLPQGYMHGMADIESRMGTMHDRPNSQFKGMFQLGAPIRKQFGVKDPSDWRQSAEGAAKYAQQNFNYLKNKMGQDPTREQLYTAHQQGPGGALALMRHPNMPANRALATLGPKVMPLSRATTNISGNLAQGLKGTMPTAEKFIASRAGSFPAAGGPETQMATNKPQEPAPQQIASLDKPVSAPPQGSVLNDINPADPSGPLKSQMGPAPEAAASTPASSPAPATPPTQWQPPAEIADKAPDVGGATPDAAPTSPTGEAPTPVPETAPAAPDANIQMAGPEEAPSMGGNDEIQSAAEGGRIHKQGGGSFTDYYYHPMINRIANAISGIESGGRYNITGKKDRRGDLPYGKYQIMGRNIPKWGAEAGYPGLTAKQFLANPRIQEEVARHQFAKIYSQSGNPAAVAGEWLGGPDWRHNRAADALGTTVPAYIRRFANLFNRGSGEAPQMMASAAPVGSSFVPGGNYSPVAYRPGERHMGIIPRIINELVGVPRAEAAETAPARNAPPRRMSYEEAGRPDMSQMTNSEIAEANGKRGWGDFTRFAQDKDKRSAPTVSQDNAPAPAPSPGLNLEPTQTTAPAAQPEQKKSLLAWPHLQNFKTNDLPTALGWEWPFNKTQQQNLPDWKGNVKTGFGPLTGDRPVDPNAPEPMSENPSTHPNMGPEMPSEPAATKQSQSAADKTGQKYWGDWRDSQQYKSDFGDFIDETLAGDVRKSDTAGTEKTPMGKYQGEGGLGSLFDLEGSGPFARGGTVRRGYEDAGLVLSPDMLKTEGSPALIPEDKRETISSEDAGGGRGSVKVNPDSSEPQFRYPEKPKLDPMQEFYERWRTNPLSQFLWHTGLHAMRSGKGNALEALGEGASSGAQAAMAALAEARKAQLQNAAAQQTADYGRRIGAEGYARGGTVRKGYADGGPLDFLGGLGDLLSPDEISEARNVTKTQSAPQQPQTNLFDDIFGGGQAAPAQAKSGAREQQGLFDSIFGGGEQAAPQAQRAAPQQDDGPLGFLSELFGATPAEAAETPRPRPAQPERAPEQPVPTAVPQPTSTDRVPSPETQPAPSPEGERIGQIAPPRLGVGKFVPDQGETPADVAKKGEIESDPEIMLAKAKIRQALAHPPQNELERKIQKDWIADQRGIIADRRKELEPTAEEKMAMATEKASKAAADRADLAQRKIEHTQLAKDFMGSESNLASTRALMESINKAKEAYKKFEPGWLNEKAGEWGAKIPKSLRPAWLEENVVGAQATNKEAMVGFSEALKGIKGQPRVIELNNIEKTLATPGLDPDTVHTIMAQMEAIAQETIEMQHDRAAWLKNHPDAGMAEYKLWENDWYNDHPLGERTKKTFDEMNIKGQTENKSESKSSAPAKSGYDAQGLEAEMRRRGHI